MASIVDPRRPGRRLPPTNRFADSSDDEEDEEERRLAEEDEQERLLSEQHGEAEESATRNKRPSGTDIEDEYGSTVKRVKRPTLTPAVLMGPKGLIRIRSEFGRKVRWPSFSKSKEDAAAVYSRSLIQAYKSFCYDLFPASAFQDVLTRIESFGSKKEVKAYLQTMREEIRNYHLEKVYGKDKASRMIQELEHGLKQQHEVDYDEIAMGVNANENESRRGPVLRSNDPTEAEPSTGGTNAPVTTEKATASQADKRENHRAAEKNFTFGDDLQDTDDELEIVAPRNPAMTRPPLTQTATTNPFESDGEEEHEESEPGTNKAERESVLVGTTTDDKDKSQNVNVGERGLENVHHDSSDPEEERHMETPTQLESPEVEEESMSSAIVQENSSSPTGAMSLDDTAPVRTTMNTPLVSTEPEADEDKRLVPEDLLTAARDQEPTSTCDEAPTVVATTEPLLASPEDEEDREESLTPTTQEPTSTSDETATIVATMDTQLESPSEQEDLVEHDIGCSFTQSDEPDSQHGEILPGVSMELCESSTLDPDTAMGE